MNDKTANVILSKLKEMPQPLEDTDPTQLSINSQPLIQDVGLPTMDHHHLEAVVEVNQNGIEISASPNGEFLLYFRSFVL